MLSETTKRGLQLGWVVGFLGLNIWIPLLTALLLEMDDVTGGIIGAAWFGGNWGMLWFLAPWRYPDLRIWKLVALNLGSAVLAALFFTWRCGLYLPENRHFLWSLLILVAMFLPALLGGRRTWNELCGNAN